MILSCVYILDDDVVCACFFAVAYFVGLVGKGERDDETKLGVVKKCCATCFGENQIIKPVYWNQGLC